MTYREKRPWQHLYGRKRWLSLRDRHLDERPLCEYCLRREVVEPATIVDHIKPHKGDEELFYDAGNLQSLCKRCHDSDKRLEESGKTVIAFGPDGWPI
ncbi:HNH endonuclease [Devosia lucknowensis]|uniref:Putative HNH nuclease YajD n=1 Tax=Devosia lucknowensis TaxID=1096929 RepID=A0A1Y6EZH0_9HYPH|nr:HNH endonuclease [Devosia lucknowensis]